MAWNLELEKLYLTSYICIVITIVLCRFVHLTPQFKEFENFDGLLLNLYLLLKNSNMKQSIFEEVQQAYNLWPLKLIKAAG